MAVTEFKSKSSLFCLVHFIQFIYKSYKKLYTHDQVWLIRWCFHCFQRILWIICFPAGWGAVKQDGNIACRSFFYVASSTVSSWVTIPHILNFYPAKHMHWYYLFPLFFRIFFKYFSRKFDFISIGLVSLLFYDWIALVCRIVDDKTLHETPTPPALEQFSSTASSMVTITKQLSSLK